MRSTPGGLPYPRRLINSAESGTPDAFSTFVSNAGAPQLVDYALVVGLGFFAASVISPQGQTSGAEYKHGTHALQTHSAESVKTKVFPAATPVFGSTPRLIPITQGSPQLADLTLQAQFYKPSPANQGRVPPSLFGSQTDPTQLQGSIWASQRTPVVVANPVASFFSIPQQQYVDSTAQVTAPLVSGSTPWPIPLVNGSPQLADLTLQAQFSSPVIKQGPPPPLIVGQPQPDTTQIAPQVWSSAAPPVLTSGVLAQFYFVPSQFDVSTNGTIVWTQSTLSPSAPVIVVPPPPAISGGSGSEYRRRRSGLSPSGFRKKPEELEVLAEGKHELVLAVEEVKVDIQFASSEPLRVKLQVELDDLEKKIRIIEEEEEMVFVISML